MAVLAPQSAVVRLLTVLLWQDVAVVVGAAVVGGNAACTLAVVSQRPTCDAIIVIE